MPNSRSPISQLPAEVLSHIIRNSLPLVLHHGGRLDFQRLRCVNSQWRQLCFSDPQFWTAVYVLVSHRRGTLALGYRNYGTRLKQWFKRAGDLPLQLYFNSNSSSLQTLEMAQVLDLLQRYQGRWEALKLDVPHTWFGSVWGPSSSAHSSTGWSSLQNLDVSLPPESGNSLSSTYGLLWPLPPLNQMPNLRRLALKIRTIHHDIPPNVFGHADLQDLSVAISDVTPPLLSMLQNFPSVRTVSIRVVGRVSPVPSPVFIINPNLAITFKNVTTLRIDASSGMFDMLKILHCPTLVKMAISVRDRRHDEAGESIATSIISFIHSHQRTLISLELPESPALTESDMHTILSSITSIQELKLHSWPYTTDSVDLPDLLNLRTISIAQFGSYAEKDADYVERTLSLLSFVERRWDSAKRSNSNADSGIAAIETVSMRVRPYMRDLPTTRIRKLQKKGINVTVQWRM